VNRSSISSSTWWYGGAHAVARDGDEAGREMSLVEYT
jgi:hypothetical protein